MKTPKAETLDRARTTPVQRARAVSPDAAWVAWSWFGLQEAGTSMSRPPTGSAPRIPRGRSPREGNARRRDEPWDERGQTRIRRRSVV